LNGIGRANYKDIIYEGQFVQDKWHGYGRAIFKDGSYHVGFWENDKKCGKGVTFRFDKKTGEISEEKGVWDKNGKLINNLDTEESKK
jgi:hypothetical protein